MTGQFIVEPFEDTRNRQLYLRSRGAGPLLPPAGFSGYPSPPFKLLVVVDADGNVAGYYTFSVISLPFTELAADEAKRSPCYPLLPAGLIGRLALATRYARQGLGTALILDAVIRATRAEPAVFALIVDAKDENARNFYLHLGFRSLINRPASLCWPVAEAVWPLITSR